MQQYLNLSHFQLLFYFLTMWSTTDHPLLCCILCSVLIMLCLVWSIYGATLCIRSIEHIDLKPLDIARLEVFEIASGLLLFQRLQQLSYKGLFDNAAIFELVPYSRAILFPNNVEYSGPIP
ncbi:hypothetical protein VNO78_28843 [Psophocarpus tetragonolobus]|uniref:Uncharacterized protein n=1 Tax=Psophocarpus tetragonolobus TaxID=3891 RepID=A0AAN9RUD7_PSOTE